jgi:hypothetical protein
MNAVIRYPFGIGIATEGLNAYVGVVIGVENEGAKYRVGKIGKPIAD